MWETRLARLPLGKRKERVCPLVYGEPTDETQPPRKYQSLCVLRAMASWLMTRRFTAMAVAVPTSSTRKHKDVYPRWLSEAFPPSSWNLGMQL